MSQLMLISNDEWLPMGRASEPLVSALELDPITKQACAEFDYQREETNFYPWEIPSLPSEWGIGLIVGGSGTGKSLLLSEFGKVHQPEWKSDLPIAGHFPDHKTAVDLFYAVGLSAVPAWTKPYQILSNGEKFRADLARQIGDNAVIDEFTSVVDRTVAKAASRTLSKYVKEAGVKNLVLASCHKDIIEWIQPDWIIDTDAGMFCVAPKECLQRPSLVAEIYEVKYSMWQNFVEHHYLNGDINKSAVCFLAVIEGKPAGFGAVLVFPNGAIKNARRSHRIVVKPEYQGFGLGVRLSDWEGEWFTKQGFRFFGRTAHSRLGEYREKSPLWRPTSMNKKARKSKDADWNNELSHWSHSRRLGYSHEYIGEQTDP